jgi:hypothetical protein
LVGAAKLKLSGLITLCLAAIALVCIFTAPALSDAYLRLRGTIVSVDGRHLVVQLREGSEERRRYGETIAVRLKDPEKITAVVPARLSDLKLGALIGANLLPNSTGAMTALEAHIHPEPEGAHAILRSDMGPTTVLIEGNISTVVRTDDNTATLTVSDGDSLSSPHSQTINVNKGTPILTFAPGSVDDLKPGFGILFEVISKSKDGFWEPDKGVFVSRTSKELPMMWILP